MFYQQLGAFKLKYDSLNKLYDGNTRNFIR